MKDVIKLNHDNDSLSDMLGFNVNKTEESFYSIMDDLIKSDNGKVTNSMVIEELYNNFSKIEIALIAAQYIRESAEQYNQLIETQRSNNNEKNTRN